MKRLMVNRSRSSTFKTTSHLSITNVTAHITIKYEKGRRLSTSSRERFAASFIDQQYNAVNLIPILIAHGLRHDLFEGGPKSIPALLYAAAQRGDRTLMWRDANLPLLAAINLHTNTLNFSRPATPQQISRTLEKMGQIASYHDHITSHDLRRVSAINLARLDPTIFKTSSTGTARAMGHHDKRSQAYYNPHEDEALYLHKADITAGRTEARIRKSKVPYQPLKGRALHDATNRLILSEPEKILGDNAPHDKEWYVQKNMHPSDGVSREDHNEHRKIRIRAITAILKAHRIAWVQAENGPRALRLSTTAKPLDFVGGSFSSVVPAKRPANDEDASIPIDPALLEGDTLVDDDEDVLDFDQLTAAEAENFDVPVDTDVVNEDDGKEGGTLLSRVSEYIFDHALEDDSKETGEDVLDVLELAFQRLRVTPTMQITKPITKFLPDEWCAKLSTINIVKDTHMPPGSGKNPPPERFQGRIPFGGTRDPPSRHLAMCPTNGCQYTTYNLQDLDRHIRFCVQKHSLPDTEESEEDNQGTTKQRKRRSKPKKPNMHKCKDKDCDFTTSSASKINTHWIEKHMFGEHGDCNFPGCDTLDLFDSLAAFKQHVKDTHPADEIEPRPCPLLGTDREGPSCAGKTFKTVDHYNGHLRSKDHMLVGKQYSELSVGTAERKRDFWMAIKSQK
ncbi:hypothetical protein LTR46_001816 [Exophiala xenobiotica]|nr:hypothetical protein LTR46_001816 [Exophiala xenobiotica]